MSIRVNLAALPVKCEDHPEKGNSSLCAEIAARMEWSGCGGGARQSCHHDRGACHCRHRSTTSL